MDIEASTPSISGKIESIIREAQTDLFLVSPYIQLEKSESDEWKRIKKVLKFALNNSINVNIITRTPDDKDASKLQEQFDRLKSFFREFQSPNCKIYLLENLHSKVYYNKSEALITSMNMYYHSTKDNYEIGVWVKQNDEENLKKLEAYIQFLISEGTLYQSDQKIDQNRQQLESTIPDDTHAVEFKVISKGYKWFKVETPDGYENKIAIAEVPDLYVGETYKAKARVNWRKTPYGYDVTYTHVHDITETRFCIACRTPIAPDYVLCYTCNTQLKQAPGRLEPRFCSRCGKAKEHIAINRPLCKSCYYE